MNVVSVIPEDNLKRVNRFNLTVSEVNVDLLQCSQFHFTGLYTAMDVIGCKLKKKKTCTTTVLWSTEMCLKICMQLKKRLRFVKGLLWTLMVGCKLGGAWIKTECTVWNIYEHEQKCKCQCFIKISNSLFR